MAAAQSTTLLHRFPPRTYVAFRKPRHPYLLSAMVMMAAGSVVLFEPAPYDVALVILMVAGILLNRLSFRFSHRLPLVLLAGFIASNFISLPNAIDPRLSFSYSLVSIYLAGSWLFFAGVASAYGYRGVTALTKGYVAAGVFSALLASCAYFRLIPFQSVLLRYGRAQGLFKDPNVYGPYLVPVLLFGLAAMQEARILSPRFWRALVVCCTSIIGIFLSFSRACWVNAGISILIFVGFELLYGFRRGSIRKDVLRIPLALAALAAITTIFLAANSETGHMLFVRLGTNGLHDYDATRFGTQRKALESTLNNPVGIGTRQSELVFQYATHNMYLRVLTENGVLGFATFFAFIVLSLLRCAKLAIALRDSQWRRLFVILTAALSGLLVNGCVIDTIRWRHFWFLLGLAWCAPGVRRPLRKWLAYGRRAPMAASLPQKKQICA